MSSQFAPRSLGSDAALVARLAAGDERALGKLYDRFGAVAYALAYAITSHEATAETVVAEAFTHLWREAHTFDDGRMTLLAWLTTDVRQRALVNRGAALTPSYVRGASATPGIDATASVVGTGLDFEGSVLAALSRDQRRIVELAFLHGQTREAIARSLQLTEAEVAHQLRVAADLLRSLVPAAPTSHPAQMATSALDPVVGLRT